MENFIHHNYPIKVKFKSSNCETPVTFKDPEHGIRPNNILKCYNISPVDSQCAHLEGNFSVAIFSYFSDSSLVNTSLHLPLVPL